MRSILVLVALFPLVSLAAVKTGRSLPSGEENPRLLASVFESPAGEVHFLEEKGSLGKALLRTPKGGLMELVRTEGPNECDRFAENAIPGCSFFFSDGSDGIEIKSQDLKEQSLFQAVSRGLQARARHVSL